MSAHRILGLKQVPTNRPRAWFYINNSISSWVFVLAVEFLKLSLCHSHMKAQEHKGFGGDGGGVTPVPIPNTEVKPTSADGTWVETPWESRSPPDFAQRASGLREEPGPSNEVTGGKARPSRRRPRGRGVWGR